MQKLDFTRNLKLIIDRLLSHEIVQQFDHGFNHPGNNIDYGNIKSFLFTSKSNFDDLNKNDSISQIFKSLELNKKYESARLADISNHLYTTGAANIINHRDTLDFYLAHKNLINYYKLSEDILFSDTNLINFDEEENDTLVFQVILGQYENLDTEKYIIILKTLTELINTVQLILDEENKIDVILLDSGSSTNVALKIGLKTASMTMDIFRKIVDFGLNYKHLKNEKDYDALLKSLDVRSTVQDKLKEGTITKEEAQKYDHLIKTRTERAIGLGVMPKELVIEIERDIGTQKMLKEISDIKLLNSGQEN